MTCRLITLQGVLLDYLRDKNPDTHTYGSPIKPAKLHLFSIQLASAMAYLESRRVVHNNLCCSNVLVASEDQIKLSGFLRPLIDTDQDVAASKRQTIKDRYTSETNLSNFIRWMVCLSWWCYRIESRLICTGTREQR